MKTPRTFSLTLLPMLSYAAAMHAALMLFAFREAPVADHRGMLVWWGFLIAYNGILSLFLRRPRELRSIVLLSGGVLLCQLGVTLWLMPAYPTFTWWMAAVGMWAALYYRCANAHLEGVKPEELMSNLEMIVLTLFVSAGIITGNAMAAGVLLHLGVGLVCIMTALIQLRTRHTRMDAQGERPMARLLLPLLLLGTAVCTAAFVVLISGHASAILTRFTAWLLKMAGLFANGVGAFFLWLFSLFPEVDGDMGAEGFEAPSLPSGPVEGMPESSSAVLYLLIAALLAAMLFIVVRIWRKVRLQGHRRMRTTARPVTVERKSLWNVIVRFLRRVAARIRFALRYVRCRNTPEGLLVWLERCMRRRRRSRGRGETVSAFLGRIAERYPDCAEELNALAQCLNCRYFGGGESLPPGRIRSMRRSIRRAMTNRKQ